MLTHRDNCLKIACNISCNIQFSKTLHSRYIKVFPKRLGQEPIKDKTKSLTEKEKTRQSKRGLNIEADRSTSSTSSRKTNEEKINNVQEDQTKPFQQPQSVLSRRPAFLHLRSGRLRLCWNACGRKTSNAEFHFIVINVSHCCDLL